MYSSFVHTGMLEEKSSCLSTLEGIKAAQDRLVREREDNLEELRSEADRLRGQVSRFAITTDCPEKAWG